MQHELSSKSRSWEVGEVVKMAGKYLVHQTGVILQRLMEYGSVDHTSLISIPNDEGKCLVAG